MQNVCRNDCFSDVVRKIYSFSIPLEQGNPVRSNPGFELCGTSNYKHHQPRVVKNEPRLDTERENLGKISRPKYQTSKYFAALVRNGNFDSLLLGFDDSDYSKVGCNFQRFLFELEKS